MGARRPFQKAEMWCEKTSREPTAGRDAVYSRENASRLGGGVEKDRHRPVVDELDGHVRTENPGFNGYALGA